MGRIRTKKNCCDCGKQLSRPDASRCHACKVIFRKANAKGKVIGVYCKKCGKELSAKKNSTSLCKNCYYATNPEPPNKGEKGQIAWNKGKHLIENENDRKKYQLKKRRERYYKMTAKEKMADSIRTLIRNSINRHARYRRKNTKTEILLGCEIVKFIVYLELFFSKGMSWENYGNGKGKWNIDHTMPVSKFDLNNIEEQKKAFHFTNCRPMWSIDNIKKGNKYLPEG